MTDDAADYWEDTAREALSRISELERELAEVLRASGGSLREAFRAYYACYEDVGTIGYFYSRADAEEAVRTSKLQKGSWTDYGDCVQSVGIEEITILRAALSPQCCRGRAFARPQHARHTAVHSRTERLRGLR